MIRATLVLLLCAMTLVLGLWTTVVQTQNHSRAAELSTLQRRWEMREAANAQARALTEAHLPGVPNLPLDPKSQRKLIAQRKAENAPAPAKGATP